MNPKSSTKNLINSNQKLKEFDQFYYNNIRPKIMESYFNEPECIKNIISRFENMVDYNVPHGKKLRGMCVYESFLNLLIEDEIDQNSIQEAKAIGWCIEFVFYKNYLIIFY